ncbi:hypothetical protein [Aquimarina algiphila]|uniref:GAF domain-containing protein n=1 Tax=Aquimarina algiphila TaxID=2047982 RepID=A0A554VPD2_9FLAO|nr:hypothetical protein [Aquimarina algiphila]TSE10324.1 hypothetical protein FOF46_04635 [Aquimarina algiphila]
MIINYKEFFKVLGSAFLEAFKWSLGKWIITVGFSLLTSFIIPIGKEVLEWDTVTALIFALVISLVLYILRFLIIALKESIKYFHSVYKESVYGDAIILLKESFAEAHYYRKTPEFQDEDFMRSMMVFCNNLKLIYDKITKSDCSVSIKVPIRDVRVGEQTILKNLTRNKENKSRDTEEYNNIEHTIIGNSAFSNCLDKVLKNNQKKYYINSDVNNEKNYRNTSKECYEDEILPYDSELVHPIVPLKVSDNDNYNCHGFICIDSNKKDSFDDKYATAIIEGVADGIYDIIEQFNSEKNDN